MRLLIMSDTHGDDQAVEQVLDIAGKPDRVFHLGDVLGGRSFYALLKGEGEQRAPLGQVLAELPGFTAVKGNCDFVDDGTEDGLDLSQLVRVERFDGLTFLLHHGHRYGFHELKKKAKELRADVVCYGHSHRKELFKGGSSFDPVHLLPRDGVRLCDVSGRLFHAGDIDQRHKIWPTPEIQLPAIPDSVPDPVRR